MRKLYLVALILLLATGCSRAQQPPEPPESPSPTSGLQERQSASSGDNALRPLPEQPLPYREPHSEAKPKAKTVPDKERKSARAAQTKSRKQAKESTAATSARKGAGTAVRRSSSAQLSIAELRHKYPTIFRIKGSAQSRKVALTFDDVPDGHFTPKVLDVLRKNGVKATFFLVGSRAEKHPDVVRRIVREGHVIGNHTYNHPLLTKISKEKFIKQVVSTEQIINDIAGYKPKFLRPPYGEINEQQLRWAGAHGYVVVNWNVDSLDWKGLDAKEVYNNILSTVRAGAIVLQHGGGNVDGNLDGTLEALPDIIETLQKRNYQIVTLPELLHTSKNR